MPTKPLCRAALCVVFAALAACGGSSGETSSSDSLASNSASSSDANSLVALSSTTYTVAATSATAVVTVNRSGASTGEAVVDYTTVNETAIAGADYSQTSGALTWGEGDTSPKVISVPVTAAGIGREFAVTLVSISGAAGFGTPTSATVVISSDSDNGSTASSSSSGGSSSGSSSGGSSSGSSGASTGPQTGLVLSCPTATATVQFAACPGGKLVYAVPAAGVHVESSTVATTTVPAFSDATHVFQPYQNALELVICTIVETPGLTVTYSTDPCMLHHGVVAGPAAAGSSSVSGNASSGSSSGSTGGSAPASVSGSTPSANGTMIPSATKIVDSAGNSWTVSGGVIALNGTPQTATSQVIVLLYFNAVIYQENSSCNWRSWTAGAWQATTKPAAAGIPACPAAASSKSSSGSSSSSGSGVPPAAAAVGYNTQTFGPAVTLNGNWVPWNFYGAGVQPPGAVSQNSDGSLFISGLESDTYGATVSTASQTRTAKGWTGTAFGGGAYFEAVISFTGQSNGPYNNGGPAFYALDVEHTSQGPYNVGWPGMPKNSAGKTYNDFFEVDFMEYDVKEYSYQNGIGNWYGYPAATRSGTHNPYQAIGGSDGSVLVPKGTDFSQFHKYGCLWVPATPSTQGYLKFYFDDVQTDSPTFYWNYYDPNDVSTYPAAPPLDGSTAMSGMDWRHMLLILGTGTTQPMTVQSVSVWQTSGANNLTE